MTSPVEEPLAEAPAKPRPARKRAPKAQTRGDGRGPDDRCSRYVRSRSQTQAGPHADRQDQAERAGVTHAED